MLFAVFALLVITDHPDIAHGHLLRFLVLLSKQLAGATAASRTFGSVFAFQLPEQRLSYSNQDILFHFV